MGLSIGLNPILGLVKLKFGLPFLGRLMFGYIFIFFTPFSNFWMVYFGVGFPSCKIRH